MPSYLDRHETRTPRTRETALFRDLKGILSVAKGRAPTLRRQLVGVDLSKLKSRADLARIPVLHRTDLERLQKETPPFGGLAGSRAGAVTRLLISSGPTFVPEGHAKDWWSAARAMNAAGFERGDIVLNSFSYHLSAGGRIVESGAHALGCAVIPAGESGLEQQVDVIRHLKPSAYCGSPEFLQRLLARYDELWGEPAPINKALFSGIAPNVLVEEHLRSRGIRVHRCYGSDELGVIAYQTQLKDGRCSDEMVVNEGVIVEIVKPDTGIPVPFGVVGEVVVTRLNADYPLLRLATGDLSALLPGPSPCGRTNLRFRGWLGRVDQRQGDTQVRTSEPPARRSKRLAKSSGANAQFDERRPG
ncbi:MAG TPA: AMP-binding protein [Beijerinckiaceae bacterium]|nr:AMP-binding protein [Beijerinckiaceae bacterium]